MQRRDFLAASCLAGLALQGSSGAAERRGGRKDLYELRIYHFASAEKQQSYDEFLGQAAIPAMNRLGIEPVGVFKLDKADNPKLELTEESTDLYMLARYSSPEVLLTANRRMMEDAEFRQAGKAVLEDSKDDPSFTRYESSLLVAFDDMPQLKIPTKADGRVYQLRIYESRNPERARAKIAMFNEGGEIGIFRKTGMNPVMFGESITGSKLPNLTYMLGFDDVAAMDAAWLRFREHPDWLALKDKVEYKETVSTITNLVLRPAKSSQM